MLYFKLKPYKHFSQLPFQYRDAIKISITLLNNNSYIYFIGQQLTSKANGFLNFD